MSKSENMIYKNTTKKVNKIYNETKDVNKVIDIINWAISNINSKTTRIIVDTNPISLN